MRLRFLSADKQKQERARLVGALLFFIGGRLVYNGVESDELFFLGVLLLVWYGMSRVAYRKNREKPLHILQEIFCFLLFFFISVFCGIISHNLSNWATSEVGIYIDLTIIVIFLVLLFFRSGSDRS